MRRPGRRSRANRNVAPRMAFLRRSCKNVPDGTDQISMKAMMWRYRDVFKRDPIISLVLLPLGNRPPATHWTTLSAVPNGQLRRGARYAGAGQGLCRKDPGSDAVAETRLVRRHDYASGANFTHAGKTCDLPGGDRRRCA